MFFCHTLPEVNLSTKFNSNYHKVRNISVKYSVVIPAITLLCLCKILSDGYHNTGIIYMNNIQ